MSQVIFGVDFQSKRAKHLEAFAAEVMNAVFPETIPYKGQGIDGMDYDTAPSEYCAPDKDSA